MGTALSGKDGLVKSGSTTIALITGWEMQKEAVTTRFASSDSAGYKATVAGVKDMTGSIEGMLDTAASTGGQPLMAEGVSGSLKLYFDATRFWTVPAVIKNFKVGKVDIDDGKVIPFTANFESNGTYTEPTW